ncbi:MAG: hypothetical protein L0Z68_01985 [Gammaproteobacteria bacterium]|nr:hypothetical protein [Gammaproteobacteria bacterium]
MAAAYLIFSLLSVIGHVSKAVIGEFADALMMTGYVWPYPLFLAVQHWIPEPGAMFLTFVLVGGLILVIVFSVNVQKWFPWLLKTRWQATICSLVLWYVPLFFVQAISVAAVWVMGYSVAE